MLVVVAEEEVLTLEVLLVVQEVLVAVQMAVDQMQLGEVRQPTRVVEVEAEAEREMVLVKMVARVVRE
jgi:hypothetical protein